MLLKNIQQKLEKNMLKIIEKFPVNDLRVSGTLFALIGFLIVWFNKSL